MPRDEKNIEKKLTTLTDFDICELYVKCVEVFAQTASRLEMERHTPLTLGKELWKETIKILKEYRDGQS